MSYYPLVLGVGFYLLVSGLPFVQAQQLASDDVEIVAEGKSYTSIHAYRLKRIKDTLKQALSSENLTEFSAEELSDIIKEIHKQRVGGTLSGAASDVFQQKPDRFKQDEKTAENGALDLSLEQMQDMLDSYYEEHEDERQLFLNPEKIKSVIIESETPSEEVFQN